MNIYIIVCLVIVLYGCFYSYQENYIGFKDIGFKDIGFKDIGFKDIEIMFEKKKKYLEKMVNKKFGVCRKATKSKKNLIRCLNPMYPLI